MEITLRNSVFLFFALTFFFSSCNKKGCTDPISLAYNAEASKDNGSCTYPENNKKTLIFYSTGTWCQYCGDLGRNFCDDITSDFPKSQIISLHENDPLTSNIGSITQSYLDSLNGSLGCPHFYVGVNSVVNPTSSPSNYSQLTSAVDDNLLLFSEVNMDLEYSINGNMMNIKVQSKLSNETPSDNYYLSTYIIEDDVVKPQNRSGNYDANFTHNNVLRKQVSDYVDVFGSSLNFDSNGDNLASFYDVPLDSTAEWNYNNLYVVAVVWQENGDDYRFVNLAR
tara:strand:- start:58 stop:900 length:843 start_codon:yes stop_codon:yes gene_type:complete